MPCRHRKYTSTAGSVIKLRKKETHISLVILVPIKCASTTKFGDLGKFYLPPHTHTLLPPPHFMEFLEKSTECTLLCPPLWISRMLPTSLLNIPPTIRTMRVNVVKFPPAVASFAAYEITSVIHSVVVPLLFTASFRSFCQCGNSAHRWKNFKRNSLSLKKGKSKNAKVSFWFLSLKYWVMEYILFFLRFQPRRAYW